MEKSKIGISSFTLKWIAIITMLIDHVGAVLYPQYLYLRIIGRISFPIFCFLLVEGALHTSNIRKYEMRLLVFALLSEIPFDYVFFGKLTLEHQNVFFTLFIGLVMIEVIRYGKAGNFPFGAFIVAIMAAELLGTDYGAGGILFIACFYWLHEQKLLKQVAFVALNLLYFGIGVQAYAGLAAIPMLLYNEKQGAKMKYFFYLFYPVHLLILYLIVK